MLAIMLSMLVHILWFYVDLSLCNNYVICVFVTCSTKYINYKYSTASTNDRDITNNTVIMVVMEEQVCS